MFLIYKKFVRFMCKFKNEKQGKLKKEGHAVRICSKCALKSQ